MTITTTGFDLVAWQQDAVAAWTHGVSGTPYRGTLEIVTGGGKTLIALACIAEVARREPDLRVAVVVPSAALAHQWRDTFLARTSLKPHEIGLLGAGRKATFETSRVVLAVINTASTRLPTLARAAQPLMLIVDECHRAGAPKHRKVLDTKADYRLGLSATPDREELDEQGEPLEYDQQAVGASLGGVVYRFTLKDARLEGWLPEFVLHHHGVALSPDEGRRYDATSRRVDDAADALRGLGVDTLRARTVSGRGDEIGDAARHWIQLTAQRKDLLYRAKERKRVVELIVQRAFDDGRSPRVILFHERVDEAIALHDALAARLPGVRVELEHSKLPERRRAAALAAFASGEAPVLVSVKALVEGIDVPEADTGVSVASTASVRQRVQALGRVLRRVVDESGVSKKSVMHLLYVADTVDDLIYAKADWTDLTGADANRYWQWKYESTNPTPVADPPRSPLPTEEQVWADLGEHIPDPPFPWPGMPSGQEYSVDTRGVVHNAFGAQIANPQGVDELVAMVRGREGGRFRVTPEHHLILVWQPGDDDAGFMLVGQLAAAFETVPAASDLDLDRVDVAALSPGDMYPGPGDKKGGTYKLSQRGGGVIERRVKGGAELALTADTAAQDKERNARMIVEAWESLERPFSRFFVNSLGHAWAEGTLGRIFVADVPAGFAWPAPEGPDR